MSANRRNEIHPERRRSKAKRSFMPQFLIERQVPGAAGLTPRQLQDIATKSVCAMEHLRGYKWIQTYVAGDKLYCVHEAPNEEIVREHSRRGGFPITSITPIATVVGPDYARKEPAAV
jgi:hypothetical protein